MLMRKTDWSFLLPVVLKEVSTILNEHGTNNGQLSLTHAPGDLSEQEKLFNATGTLFDYNAGKFVAKESDFTVFNNRYTGTYLHEIYNQLGCIGRMRIMVMEGPKAYTVHRDVTTRFHMALTTNENCFFVFPRLKQQLHVPADGNIYELDTKEYHTFLNGSRETRIHLVMDNLSSYE